MVALTTLAPVEPMTFAEFLRRLMDERGIKATQVATYAGVGRTTVNYWLRGVSIPERESVAKLADALSLDLDLLRGIVEGRPLDPHAIDAASHTLHVDDPKMIPLLQRLARRGFDQLRRFERAMAEVYGDQLEDFIEAEARERKDTGAQGAGC